MRRMVLNSLSAVALAAAMGAAAGAASAEVPPPPPPPADAPPPPPPFDMDGPDEDRPDRPDRDADLTRAAFVDARVARLTALDADRDGTVSAAEREAAFEAKRAERANERFAKLDANGDGAISRAEFEAGRPDRPERPGRGPRPERDEGPRMAMRGPGAPGGPDGPEGREPGPVVIAEVAAKLGERFDKMDADKNGVVTAEERRAALPPRREGRPHHRPDRAPASPAPASE
jgi:hypothetical protein